jgi:hypothetical protein
VWVTITAILCGAVVALPPPAMTIVAALLLQAILLAMLLGVVHARGRLRTFFLGGLVAAAYHALPELLSPGRGADAALTELMYTLLADATGQPPMRAAMWEKMIQLAAVIEPSTSVLTLGFFSVWFRGKIERWSSRTSR